MVKESSNISNDEDLTLRPLTLRADVSLVNSI